MANIIKSAEISGRYCQYCFYRISCDCKE